MGSHHELKTWPPFFQAVAQGSKTFELRKDDRDIQEGDTVCLMEWDSLTESYTGASITKTVGWVVRGAPARFFGLKSGYCVFSLLEAGAQ